MTGGKQPDLHHNVKSAERLVAFWRIRLEVVKHVLPRFPLVSRERRRHCAVEFGICGVSALGIARSLLVGRRPKATPTNALAKINGWSDSLRLSSLTLHRPYN